MPPILETPRLLLRELTWSGRTVAAWHGWLGLVTLLVFLASGLVMRYHEPPLADLEPGPRLLFRSRHIYILLTALVNLLLWLRRSLGTAAWVRRLALAGSLFAALAPMLAILAFFFETSTVGGPSAASILAVQAALAAVLLHGAAELPARRSRSAGSGQEPAQRSERGG